MGWSRVNDPSDSVLSGANKRKQKQKSLKKDLSENASEALKSWKGDLKKLFQFKDAFSDIIAGLTVSAVALPLNIALAVAVGLPASAGIISGAIGGFIAGFFGGSNWQVSGPAAALNIMVLAIYQQFGATGVAASAIATGVLSIILSIFGLGKIIAKLPEAVIAGFTTGVGIKLLNQQIPHLFGIKIELLDILMVFNEPTWLKEVSWFETLSGVAVIFFILSFKSIPKIPGALLGLVSVTFVSSYLNWDLNRVGAFDSTFPALAFPLIPSEQMPAFLLVVAPLAILAAVESLLSASVADRLVLNTRNIKSKHNSTMELFGQGLGNLASGLFSGMTITGVVVRTSVNVTSGSKTRLSILVHSVILLVSMLYFSQYIALIPIAALAGLLCIIGFRLIDFGHFFHLLKSNKLESVAFLVAAIGTVNDRLFLGLVFAILIAFIGYKIKTKLEEADQAVKNENPYRRAFVPLKETEVIDWRLDYSKLESKNTWIDHVTSKPTVDKTAYVHPNATLIGKIVVDRKAHIAAETSVRADEGTPFYVGQSVNLQDGVVLHALKDKYVEIGNEKWAIYISRNVSVAHQALVHGPCFVGNDTFIGFKSIVHDSVVGSHCFIGHGAVVVGVQVPDNKFVPHGSIVDSQEKVDALPDVSPGHMHFNHDVVEVNEGLGGAYHWAELQEHGKNEELNNLETNNNKENGKWKHQRSSQGLRSGSSRVGYL